MDEDLTKVRSYDELPENAKKYIEFIEKYGFLYPLPENEYTAVEASDLIEIINRIKSTIRLYSYINKKDYRGVLIHVVYLLYTPVTELRIGDDVFSTCTHRFKSLLDSYNLFPDLSREPEVAANGTYSVDDAFLGNKNAVDISFYNAVRSGSDTNLQGSKDPWFKNLMAMYMGCKDVDEETRFPDDVPDGSEVFRGAAPGAVQVHHMKVGRPLGEKTPGGLQRAHLIDGHVPVVPLPEADHLARPDVNGWK